MKEAPAAAATAPPPPLAAPDPRPHTHAPPPLATRLRYAATVSALTGLAAATGLARACREYLSSPSRPLPDIVKTYECRTYLPVRIFFPATYDQTSPDTLPILVTIHGSDISSGRNSSSSSSASDDDAWNRAFADGHDVLVVALEYRRAPWYPFPTALHDLEALYLAVAADVSLPADPDRRAAIAGFGGGGTLAAALCQLDSVRGGSDGDCLHAPGALLTVCAPVEVFTPIGPKLRKRPYKPALGPLRGDSFDGPASLAPAFEWAYVPYHHSLTDPLLSPVLAPRDRLPPFLCVVAAELDYRAHEAWVFACRMAGRREPRLGGAVGRPEPGPRRGALELEDDRFAWEEAGVKWLLVPDVVHGFDLHEPAREMMSEEGVTDADVKTALYMAEVAAWLGQTAWRQM